MNNYDYEEGTLIFLAPGQVIGENKEEYYQTQGTAGKSAQEYIQNKIIDIAKDKIFDGDKSISEIAYELGFKYPQHFSRLFKQRVGFTPNEYRNLN